MNHPRSGWMRASLAIGVALVCLVAVLSKEHTFNADASGTSVAPRPSYLYLYNPSAQTFFTIPLASGALPVGVAVTGNQPTQIWIADYGLNQVTRVLFTSTVDYALIAYPITSTVNSGPYRIAVHGNEVWFTERGANRVGRLNATTGQLDEFYQHGLSANAGLSDIKVAADGGVWIGAQLGQRLIQLSVISPSDYSFTEYTDTLRPGFVVAPAYLAIDANSSVWLTVPDSSYHPLARFTPAMQFFVWPTLPADSRPEDVEMAGDYAWCADSRRNTIDQVQFETFSRVNSYGPVTRPVEIVAASPSMFWITEDDGQGAIAQFIYTSVVSSHLSSISLPVIGLRPAGIDVASDGGVWVAATVLRRVFLPLVMRNQ